MSYFVEKNDNYVFFLPLYHSGTLFLWRLSMPPEPRDDSQGVHGTQVDNEAHCPEKGTDILFVVPIAVMILNAIKSGQLKLSDYDLSSWKYLEIAPSLSSSRS